MKFYSLFKKVAFRFDPELAHTTSIWSLRNFPDLLAGAFDSHIKGEEKYDFSLILKDGNCWKFPIGLAAGLDKNAEAINFFRQTNFGAVEVGTITPKAQPGNPKPRMFRLLEEESLLNRMGFNNEGMDRVFENITQSKREDLILGINLGKNKATSADEAPEDYRKLYEKLAPLASYLVINVSSPNTPGLRDLQSVNALKEIFKALEEERSRCQRPLYLKISPDLAHEQIPDIISLCQSFKLAGIIATNTTIMPEIGLGGVSGKLVCEPSRKMRQKIFECLGPKYQGPLEIIGVGGISNYQDLKEFWTLGGRVCQIYTSFIYQGPEIFKEIKRELIKDMSSHGIYKLSEFIEILQR